MATSNRAFLNKGLPKETFTEVFDIFVFWGVSEDLYIEKPIKNDVDNRSKILHNFKGVAEVCKINYEHSMK